MVNSGLQIWALKTSGMLNTGKDLPLLVQAKAWIAKKRKPKEKVKKSQLLIFSKRIPR